MKIFSETFAQHTVREMEKIIPHNVNMMSEEGIIIASKDRDRIGTFHEGALKVIQEKKTVRIFPEETLRGSREGINMPVLFQGRILGVLGITGHPDEVENYGNIILKMTELMIKEAYAKHELQLETQAKERFLHEWLLEQYSDAATLRLRSETLDIDLDHPRIAVIFELKDEKMKTTEVEKQGWIEELIVWFSDFIDLHPQDIISSWRRDEILFLASTEKRDQERFTRKVIKLLMNKTEKSPYTVKGGIGGENSGIQGCIQSFHEADHALKLSSGSNPFVYFNRLGAESLLIYLSEEDRKTFVSRFFPFMLENKYSKLLETLDAFFAHDQSIDKTKDALFIHKNTLQYRLKKVHELTGYDPRKFREGLHLYLALKMRGPTRDN